MLKTKLSIVIGLVMRGDRIIVPNKYQQRVDVAHTSHQGMTKTKNLMRETLWFPVMDTMIEREVRACLPCQAVTHGSLNKEPLKTSRRSVERSISRFWCPFPSGEYLLVITDDYIRFPKIKIIRSTSAQTVIPRVDEYFLDMEFLM